MHPPHPHQEKQLYCPGQSPLECFSLLQDSSGGWEKMRGWGVDSIFETKESSTVWRHLPWRTQAWRGTHRGQIEGRRVSPEHLPLFSLTLHFGAVLWLLCYSMAACVKPCAGCTLEAALQGTSPCWAQNSPRFLHFFAHCF